MLQSTYLMQPRPGPALNSVTVRVTVRRSPSWPPGRFNAVYSTTKPTHRQDHSYLVENLFLFYSGPGPDLQSQYSLH